MDNADQIEIFEIVEAISSTTDTWEGYLCIINKFFTVEEIIHDRSDHWNIGVQQSNSRALVFLYAITNSACL